MNPGDGKSPGGPPRGPGPGLTDESAGSFGAPRWGGPAAPAGKSHEHADPRVPFGGSGWTGSPGLASEVPEPPPEKPGGRRRRSKGPTHTRRTLAALGASVDLLRDAAGVAHLYAKSERDAYAALGFCMAEDRLWQMDFFRRLATGRSAELLGQRAARRDALVRTVGIPRRAAAAASRLDGIARDVLAAFAAGVNAARGLAKPPECERLGYELEPWTIADSLAIELYLAWGCASVTWPEKILVARALASGGVDRARVVSSRPVDFVLTNDERLGLWQRIDPRVIDLVDDPSVGVPTGHVAALGGTRGPALSASLELPLMSPSPLYPACLEGPGFRSVGVAHVGLPGLLAGRNEHVAWGVTGARLDDADCVMEELDGIGAFRSESGWEKLSRRREMVRVRDGETLRLEVAETRHGPLLSHLVEQLDGAIEGERPVALALCWGANSLGTALPGLLAMARAKDSDDVLAAAPLLDRSPLPLEAVAIDTAGMAVTFLGGAKPVRAPAAALPLRGWMSEARWSGVEPLSGRCAAEPGDVAFATGVLRDGANEAVLEFRSRRLAERLGEAVGAADLEALATDVMDEAARAGLPAVRAALDAAGEAEACVARVRPLLADWAGQADAASGGAAAFYVALMPHLVDALLPPVRFGPIAACREAALAAVTRLLREPDDLSDEQRGAIVASFAAAERWLEGRFGSDPTAWTWGGVQTVLARHPVPDPEHPPGSPQAAPGSPFTVLGHRSTDSKPPFRVDVATAARVAADLSGSGVRIVGLGADIVLEIGRRPKGERVELISG